MCTHTNQTAPTSLMRDPLSTPLAMLKASGGLTLSTAAEVAATGVEFIAVGALSHSSPIPDMPIDVRG